MKLVQSNAKYLLKEKTCTDILAVKRVMISLISRERERERERDYTKEENFIPRSETPESLLHRFQKYRKEYRNKMIKIYSRGQVSLLGICPLSPSPFCPLPAPSAFAEPLQNCYHCTRRKKKFVCLFVCLF